MGRETLALIAGLGGLPTAGGSLKAQTCSDRLQCMVVSGGDEATFTHRVQV
jgi:hypothetical protein